MAFLIKAFLIKAFLIKVFQSVILIRPLFRCPFFVALRPHFVTAEHK